MSVLKKIEKLKNLLPNSLTGYTIVYDQINAKTFALAKINPNYVDEESKNYAHQHISNFMNFKECECYLKGMQDQFRLMKENKIKY
mgnify:CR=1 FL=1